MTEQETIALQQLQQKAQQEAQQKAQQQPQQTQVNVEDILVIMQKYNVKAFQGAGIILERFPEKEVYPVVEEEKPEVLSEDEILMHSA